MNGDPNALITTPSTTIASDANMRAHPTWAAKSIVRLGAMAGKRCDVIFLGDSITQMFVEDADCNWMATEGVVMPPIPNERRRDAHGLDVWMRHYAGRHFLNFGVGSDGTEHMIWRLRYLFVGAFKPKVVVVLAGTNNVTSPPADIAAGVRAVVDECRVRFPAARVICMSILPSTRAVAITAAANEIIRTFADDQAVFHFDLASKMTPIGDSWRGLCKDRLHMTPEGYELWATEMEPLLSRLLAMPPLISLLSPVPGGEG